MAGKIMSGFVDKEDRNSLCVQFNFARHCTLYDKRIQTGRSCVVTLSF